MPERPLHVIKSELSRVNNTVSRMFVALRVASDTLSQVRDVL